MGGEPEMQQLSGKLGRTEQDRRKRQINRRIREVLAIRRTLALLEPSAGEPAP
jgi:hypothetical protein